MDATLGRDWETIRALVRRSANELIRVPGAAVPGVLAPTIFFLGLTAVFGNLTLLPGFTTDNYASFMVPVSMLQGAGFTGAAMGVNLARDIEFGLFDRFLASPAPRWVLLTGLVLSAAIRSVIPSTFVFLIALVVGAHFPGPGGLVVTYLCVMGTATIAACWSALIALRFKTQSAAPLMQTVMLAAVLCTTAYAPQALLTGWLATAAEYNPFTQVVDAARQGFVGGVSWGGTWPAIVVILALTALLGTLALRGMRRTAY
ncbi:MAG TPA: ABC transporter permease [Solirubrobacterales bacterium]|nr:ABC transporter permease [Solirubrobacterales bacterium]